jgi:hypothetical protein
MNTKYALNISIYFYNDDENILLKEKELISYDYTFLKSMLDELPGEYYYGEYEPELECIKCSAVIYSLSDEDYEKSMIEKYCIYKIKDIVDINYLNLFDKLCDDIQL